MGALPKCGCSHDGGPAPKRHLMTPAACLDQSPIPPPADHRAVATEPCTWRCCAAGEAPARCSQVRAKLLSTFDGG
jgi:hypothetical protein